MKKFALTSVIFFLILSTATIKNTTKKIEDEIFSIKENIRVLESEFEDVSLEYDYLSSAEKLLEYQSLYFEDNLIIEIKNRLPKVTKDIVGINLKRKHIFMNKWIKFGGRYPLILFLNVIVLPPSTMICSSIHLSSI